jgi:hypothetical protein
VAVGDGVALNESQGLEVRCQTLTVRRISTLGIKKVWPLLL